MITEQDKNKVLEERRQKKLEREQAEKERQEHLAEVNDPDVWIQVLAKHRNNHPVSYTVSFDDDCTIQSGNPYVVYHTEPTVKSMAFEGLVRFIGIGIIVVMCYLSCRLGVR